jgi:hypothetical protein
MTDSTSQLDFQQPSRRQAIRLLAGGVAALAMGACTPATILFRSYPEQYRPGTTATRRALLAFTDTVVPGLTPEELQQVTALEDRFYPMAKYCDFLASDLDRRAMDRHERPFSALTPAQRTALVRKALDGDAVTRKLYTGAVFLTQAAVYGGIHDDRAGCRLTGFPGGYHLTAPATLTSAQTARFVTRSQSPDGNPT